MMLSKASQSAASMNKVLQKSGASTLGQMAAFSASTKPLDYLVVGGGSAGCVLASRLSESASSNVMLLEAGKSDRGHWDSMKIQMPAGLTYNLADTRYNWGYHTTPQPHMNNRRIHWPRGRVLGGSSSLNAMVYIRGHAKDYDLWEKLGAKDWDYAHCLPYFRKAQTHCDGPDEYRGGDGPLHVTRDHGALNQPLFKAFIDAAVEAGYPFTEDMNGYQQEGFGFMDRTIYQGRRWNTANAYIRPIEKERTNLEVSQNVFARKLVFDESGKKVIGVQVEDFDAPGKNQRTIYADKVILAGGAINSPHLLMHSGIGDAKMLEKVGIPVRHHLPGVGQNLQDHLEFYAQYKVTKPITLHNCTWKYPHNMIKTGLEWILNKTGDGASAHLESGGFIRSRAGIEWPDLQYHFFPGALTGQLTPGSYHGMQAHCGPLRATSRGEMTLASNDPREHPILNPNYLSTPEDRLDMRNAVRLTQEIFQQDAFKPYIGEAMLPSNENMTDDEIDAFIAEHAETAFHPSCTNKMGEDDMSVVNSETKLHGIENIHVVDSSIMPHIVSGNLNAPTIMLAEKAADIIKQNTPLAPSNAPVYQSPNWETQQR